MLALFTAHAKKDQKGLEKEGLFQAFDKETILVHDYLLINYNESYDFQNAECHAHLIRDLRKIMNYLEHDWAGKLIDLLVTANQNRNAGIELHSKSIMSEFDEIIQLGERENANEKKGAYYLGTELTLLKRLKRYKDNYLMFVVNEKVPFTNNVSERSLRMSKTKMKVSGQFQNVENAEYYAMMRSYLETGKRQGLNSNVLLEYAVKGEY